LIDPREDAWLVEPGRQDARVVTKVTICLGSCRDDPGVILDLRASNHDYLSVPRTGGD
jgi:hypothetical protein